MNERIVNVMKEVFGVSAIAETASQENLDKWDSLNHLNLIVGLEDEFGVTFEPEEIAEMKDYKTVEVMVNKKLA